MPPLRVYDFDGCFYKYIPTAISAFGDSRPLDRVLSIETEAVFRLDDALFYAIPMIAPPLFPDGRFRRP